MSFTVQIAYDSTFENLLLDTTTLDTVLLFSTVLQPKRKFFWKVSLPDASASSFFQIRNVAKDLQGDHFVNARYRESGLNFPNPIDSTYTTSVYFEDNFDKLWISESSSQVEINVPFHIGNTTADQVWYASNFAGNLRYVLVRFFVLQDSFHVTVGRGGQAGEGTYDFYGKK